MGNQSTHCFVFYFAIHLALITKIEEGSVIVLLVDAILNKRINFPITINV